MPTLLSAVGAPGGAVEVELSNGPGRVFLKAAIWTFNGNVPMTVSGEIEIDGTVEHTHFIFDRNAGTVVLPGRGVALLSTSSGSLVRVTAVGGNTMISLWVIIE